MTCHAVELAPAPLATSTTPIRDGIAATAIIVGGCALLGWLAWRKARAMMRAKNESGYWVMLMIPVLVFLAATKNTGRGAGEPSGPDRTRAAHPAKAPHPLHGARAGQPRGGAGDSARRQSRAPAREPPAPAQPRAAEAAQPAAQRAYTLDAEGANFAVTNFFAGRVHPAPRAVATPGNRREVLAFAPENPFHGEGAMPGEHNPDGALLALYDLPADIQAVAALVTLGGRRAPSRATLLRAPDLVLQQAPEDYDDPETTSRVCRLMPVGAGRRMLVNNTETSLVPRDAWFVLTVEADATHPIDPGPAATTLGGDGNPRHGGSYWPGFVAEVVLVPREWLPGDGSPVVPVPWDDTLRNALESYLFYKHRRALPNQSWLPSVYDITLAKVDLVEKHLGLPNLKIPGTLLMVR